MADRSGLAASTAVILAGALSGSGGAWLVLDDMAAAQRVALRPAVVAPAAPEPATPVPAIDLTSVELAPCPLGAVAKTDELAVDATVAPAAELTGRAFVKADALNLRPAPGTKNEPLGQLAGGDEIAVLDRRMNGGGLQWLKIRVVVSANVRTGREGWVAAPFVTVEALAKPARSKPVEFLLPCPVPGPFCLPGTQSIFPPSN